jgi:hypothetical protein
MLAKPGYFRSLALALSLGALSGCAHPPSAAAVNSQSSAPASASKAAAPTAKAAPAAVSTPEARAQAFVASVIGGQAGIEQRYSVVILGPALYSAIKALDPSVAQLGTAVELMIPSHSGKAEGRMCSSETCARFLRAKGLHDFLLPFAAARYRFAASEERAEMLERSPEMFPEATPATVAVAGEQLLGLYTFEEGTVWLELISEPVQLVYDPDPDAPPTPEQRAIESSKCLKLDTVHLNQSDEAFGANTSTQDVLSGVTQVIGLLDARLLEKKSRANGAWTVRITFGPKGIRQVEAPPTPGVDPQVLVRVNQKALGKAPFSRGPQLSIGLDLTLRPCAK